MPVGNSDVFENTTELGEDRVPAPSPTVEFLASLANHLDVAQHHKPSLFTETCNDLCRFGYDHPEAVSSEVVLGHLLSALRYKPENDDDDEGEGVLTVPVASIKALAVLTSSPLVRGRLHGFMDGMPAILTLLQLPYATPEVRTQALTALTNACCSRPLALMVGRHPGAANLVRTLISPPYTIAVQSRALSLATHLVSNIPLFARDFAAAGAINAIAQLLIAPSARNNFITQNRAALLLGALSRYPILLDEIAEVAKNAPALREAAAKDWANAAAAKAERKAAEAGDAEDSEEEDEDDEDDSESGSGEDGEGSDTEYEPDGQEGT